MAYFNLINISELVALCCSFFLLRRGTPARLRLVILMMLVIGAAESLGLYFNLYLHRSNHIVYNVSTVLCILLLLLLFLKEIDGKGLREWAIIVMALYVGFCLVNVFFIQGKLPGKAPGTARFATYNYISGSILLCFFCCSYLLRAIRMPVYISLWSQPLFWLAAAVILRYIPMSIVYAVFEYLSYKKELNDQFFLTFKLLNNVLCVIFYALISLSSLCRSLFPISTARSLSSVG